MNSVPVPKIVMILQLYGYMLLLVTVAASLC